MNEYKFTIFLITLTHWSSTALSGNKDSFVVKKICTSQIIQCLIKINSLSAGFFVPDMLHIYYRYLSEMHSHKLNDEQGLHSFDFGIRPRLGFFITTLFIYFYFLKENKKKKG